MEHRPVYKDTAHERQFEKSYLDIEAAHQKARESLAASEIDPSIFTKYDPAMIERDQREVTRLEGLFEQTPSKIYGDILEAIICEHGELSDWFGPEAQVIKTARFDDYINKIDMVVEFEDETQRFSHLALGVDVTFGSHDLQKKFDAIRAKIDSGTLGDIKYFHSDRQHFTGEKRRVPQVVIGAEIERVKELGLLWMNRRNGELGRHPIQDLILNEIALQLETFAAYATALDIKKIYEQELERVRAIMQSKSTDAAALKDDRVFAEIRRQLESFGESR